MYTIKAICKRSIYIKIFHIVMYTCNYQDREYVLNYTLVYKFVYKIYYNVRYRSRKRKKRQRIVYKMYQECHVLSFYTNITLRYMQFSEAQKYSIIFEMRPTERK